MFSIWEKETFFAPQDVIIVGSGFVGLWSALHLKTKYPKLKVTVVERGLIPIGASTRNAGFATFGSLSELIWDAQTMGTDKMLQVTEMRYQGLERIRKQFGKKAIDLEACGGYELFSQGSIATKKLEDDMAYLNALLRPVTSSKKTFRLNDEQLDAFGFGKTGHLVQCKQEGYLHPGKLIQTLLQTVQGLGVTVLTNTEVVAVHPNNKSIKLTTTQPFHLTTKQLLLCTNAFTKTLLPDIDILPARGQILLTSPIKNLPFKGAFHSEEGFYYFRNLGNKVLLGGARHKAFADEATTAFETTAFIQQELENFLANVILPHFQNQYSIEHRWSGIMAFGSEKTPIVKQVSENVFCAVRMSGVGVALAPMVAQQVTRMMLA